eukprot:Lankesteria_metandrocarpae@DN5466_c1_g1_i2.p3
MFLMTEALAAGDDYDEATNVAQMAVDQGTTKQDRTCRFYAAGKKCYRKQCNFSYGTRPNTERPLPAPRAMAKRCWQFEKGYCSYGDKCRFTHASQETKGSTAKLNDAIAETFFFNVWFD